MRFRGGYNVMISGRPDSKINSMPAPSHLSVPLKSRRFDFSDIKIQSGDHVAKGDILAVDPDNFNIPLLSPANATVQIHESRACIDLMVHSSDVSLESDAQIEHVDKTGITDEKISKLIDLGAWEFFYDAFTSKLPDPAVAPQAVIISTVALEPFVVTGRAQLIDKLVPFCRGLEQLQSLVEYQQIYLVIPKVHTEFSKALQDQIRGYAWVNVIEIDIKYPHDNFNLIARHIGLRSANGPIWSLRTEGVFAVDNVLTNSSPAIERIISVAGPAVEEPTNIKVTVGHPVEDIISEFNIPKDTRAINGGMMTGSGFGENAVAVDSECRGITFLPEHTTREFIGWMRPGFDRHSFARAFGSFLRPSFKERLTTAVRGEVRPCISCNFCQEICPAGIIPHVIHKYLYNDQIEEAQEARIDLCIQCGLCSYVCTSKLELSEEFAKAMEIIEEENEAARIAAEKQKADSENQQE